MVFAAMNSDQDRTVRQKVTCPQLHAFTAKVRTNRFPPNNFKSRPHGTWHCVAPTDTNVSLAPTQPLTLRQLTSLGRRDQSVSRHISQTFVLSHNTRRPSRSQNQLQASGTKISSDATGPALLFGHFWSFRCVCANKKQCSGQLQCEVPCR